jgi:hypothetical protein
MRKLEEKAKWLRLLPERGATILAEGIENAIDELRKALA